MLILTRRAGESLYLDDNIRITILGVQGKQVKIGLDVPPEMNIYREEVYQRVKEENTLATTINNNDLIAAAQLTNREEVIIDTRLGQQTIEPEKIINFPQGLIGFENQQKFILLQIQPASPFIILQSIDNPKLGLLVADPYSFIKHYTVQLNDTEKTILQSEIHNLAILVTMTIPKGKPALTRLNLTGPILINYDTKIGLQVPQPNLETTSHIYIYHPGEESTLNK